jgi:hypothetical protein
MACKLIMGARHDIGSLLEQWRRLTEAEGEAIQATAWATLKEIHTVKVELQKDLTAAIQKWTKAHPDVASSKNPFQAEVSRLISLEARNGEYLAAQYQKAAQNRKMSERALSTLRKVKQSYVRKTETGWDSYS